MVSAARLSNNPKKGGMNTQKGPKRVKLVRGELVTSKNVKTVSAKLKSRLTGQNIAKTAKGKFVLAKGVGNQGKVLIRTKKTAPTKVIAANGQIKKVGKVQNQPNQPKRAFTKPQFVQRQQNVQPRNQQRQQTQQRPQNQPKNQQRPQNQQIQRNQQPNQPRNQRQQLQKPVKRIQQNQKPVQKQVQQPKKQFQNRKPLQQNVQNRNGNALSDSNLALDIISILLEDKKKNKQQQVRNIPQQRPVQQQRRQWQQQPRTVYVQAPPQEPVYIDEPAPQTVYVKRQPRRVIQQQPVKIVRRQAPVQVVRPAASRVIQRAVQRRFY